jgi:hypothetical protein
VSHFSACFLLVFAQLAVGGFVALAVPPFGVIERGFFKSSAGVFLGCAILYIAGRIALVVRAGEVTTGNLIDIGLWVVFAAAATLYFITLWGDRARVRARAFAASLLLGLLALTASASVHRLGPLLSPATILYPISFTTGAMALGGVAAGMLLGHWYLIDLGLSIEPMRRLFRFFVTMTVAHVGVLLLTLLAMALTPGPSNAAVGALLHDHGALLVARFALGPLAALVLGWMIHRTLQIPQTMAATGLFYIAILFVMVGEILGRLILFRTSLPL